jgi:hypothetical protein
VYAVAKSWKLVNSAGTTDFIPGQMDILLDNGHVVEIEGLDILDQRVKKCSSEAQGSNYFASWWGSPFKNALGQKSTRLTDASFFALPVMNMANGLKISQDEVASRVDLTDEEQIEKINELTIMFSKTTVKVKLAIQAKSGDSVTSTAGV